MGSDKALLKFRGVPLIAQVLQAARTVADDLLIIATDRSEYEQFGARLVPDHFSDAGPLGGIYTAIVEARHPYCLVLACDMPFVKTELLRFMAEQPRDYDVLVPTSARATGQGGHETYETLHAIYGKGCLDPLARHLRAGQLKVAGFFPDVDVRRIEEDTLRRYDPDLLSFFNANTPDEFEQALRVGTSADRLEPSSSEPRSLGGGSA